MKGINKSQHSNLIKALVQLKELLQNDSSLLQMTAHLEELEKMYRNYELALSELSVLIAEYEESYSYVKVQYLGKKLKELRKEIPVENSDFVVLIENIRLAYGT